MKATLIKKHGIYMLLQNSIIIASSDKNFNGDLFLSEQNCNEIFGVVDVEKLAEEETIHNEFNSEKSFIKGFNKAMELNKNKMFSFKDIQDFINNENPSQYPYIAVNLERKLNEWDVEILTDICGDKVYAVPEYVLDEEGYLILKKL